MMVRSLAQLRIGTLVTVLCAATLVTVAIAPHARAQATTPEATARAAARQNPESTDSAAPALPGPLPFVKVYVPADSVARWPRENIRYAPPVDQKEFDRLTAVLRQQSEHPPRTVVVVKAEYYARLVDSRLIGNANLAFRKTSEGRSTFSLQQLAPAGQNFLWHFPEEGAGTPESDIPTEEKPTTATTSPAVVGLSSGDQVVLVVERSANLTFDWSQSGRSQSDGSLMFHMEAPPGCPTTVFTLDLPESLVPRASGSVIRGPLPVPEPAVVPGESPLQPPANGAEKYRRWKIHVGGQVPGTLLLVSAGATSRKNAGYHVHESTVYDILDRGIEQVATFRFDDNGRLPEQIRLAVDPGLRVTSVMLDSQPVVWTPDPQKNGRNSYVVIERPWEYDTDNTVFRVTAISPLKTDVRFDLPRIQCPAKWWKSSTAIVRVSDQLRLKWLDVFQMDPKTKKLIQQGRQTTSKLTSGGLKGEVAEIRLFKHDAKIEFMVGRPRQSFTCRAGEAISWSRDSILSRTVFRIDAQSGRTYSLQGAVFDPWTVASIEAVSLEPGGEKKDILLDWTVGQNPGQRNQQLLTVRLQKALSLGRSIELVVQCRRGGVGLNKKDKDTYQVFNSIKLLNVQPERELFAVRAEPPYLLKTTGDASLERLDPENLSPQDSQLFDAIEGSELFLVNPSIDNLRMSLSSEKPLFSADIDIRVSFDKNSVTETSRIRCKPESKAVRTLIVHFSRARERPPVWSIVGEMGGEITARLLPAMTDRKDQWWELTLRPARNAPFVITATRTMSFDGQFDIALVSLPEAITQTGRLGIFTRSLGNIKVAAPGLRAIANEPSNGADYGQLRESYRYESSGDMNNRYSTVSVKLLENSRTSADAWAWSCDLRSRFSDEGIVQHDVNYLIQNAGSDNLVMLMPAGAKVLQCDISYKDPKKGVIRTQVHSLDNNSNSITVPLASGIRFFRLTATYRTSAAIPFLSGELETVLPLVNIPVLRGTWTVRPPRGYLPKQTRADNTSISRFFLHRLLGVLSPSQARAPFQVFSSADWRSILSDRSNETLGPSAADRFLEVMGEDHVTWGEVVRAYDSARTEQAKATAGPLPPGDRLPRLIVDPVELANEGIAPDTPTRTASGQTPRQRGLSLLAQSNLTLLVADDVILLTGAEVPSLSQNQLLGNVCQNVAEAMPGALADKMKAAASSSVLSGHYLQAEVWRSLTSVSASPWPAVPRPPLAGIGDPRSLAVRIPLGTDVLGDGATAQLRVCRYGLIHWSGIVVFFLAATIGTFLLRGRPSRIVFILMAAAGIAMLVPDVYMPLSSGLFAGLLTGLVLGFVARRSLAATLGPGQDSQNTEKSASHLTRQSQLPGALLLALFASLGSPLALVAQGTSPAKGQPAIVTKNGSPEKVSPDGTSNNEETLRRPFRVLSPMDVNNKPLGRYHLPEDFYLELVRRTQQTQSALDKWLLRTASYRGSLSANTLISGMQPASITAEFVIETFQHDIPVRIPLERRAAGVSDRGAFLDSKPIVTEWDKEEKSFVVMIARPGVHTLTLALAPPIKVNGPCAGFSFVAPRLLRSTLDLSVPVNAPEINIAGSVSPPRRNPATGRIVAVIGSSGRMGVNWVDGNSKGTSSKISIKELYWLICRSDSVVLEAKYQITAQEPISEFTIKMDPRLNLLPPAQSSLSARVNRSDSGNASTVLVSFAKPQSGSIEVDLSFLVSEIPEMGEFLFPQIVSQSLRVTSRVAAVTVDPTHILTATAATEPEMLSEASFISQWGPSQQQPTRAWRLGVTPRPWQLNIQPQPIGIEADQLVSLKIERGSASVAFEADIDAGLGQHFQYRVDMPGDLKIRNVTFESGPRSMGVPGTPPAVRAAKKTPVRWSRHKKDNVVTIFLGRVATGNGRLKIEGDWPVATPGKTRLPRIRLVDASITGLRYRIFREPNVLAKVINMRNIAGVPDARIGLFDPDYGRLVADLRTTGEDPQAEIETEVNQPRYEASLATLLREVPESLGSGDMSVEVDYCVRVKKGTLDALHLEVPGTWKEPVKIEPPARHRLVKDPVTDRLLLTLWPDQPIKQNQQFKIHAPGTFSTSDAIPNITARFDTPPSRELRRYLILPTQFSGQPITWTTNSLTRELSAKGFDHSIVGPDDPFETWLINNPRYRAVLKTETKMQSKQRIELADYRVFIARDGSGFGTATFDINPDTHKAIVAQMPSKKVQLLTAFVAGVPVDAAPVGDKQVLFLLKLGPDRLPQRVELLFRYLPGSDNLAKGLLSVPEILTLKPLSRMKPLRRIWTIHTPEGIITGADRSDANASETGSQTSDTPFRILDGLSDENLLGAGRELVHLDAARHLLNLPSYVRADIAPRDIRNWYARWALRLRNLQDRIEQFEATSPGQQDELHRAVANIEKSLVEEALNLQVTPPFGTTANGDDTSFEDMLDVFESVVGVGPMAIIFQQQKEVPQEDEPIFQTQRVVTIGEEGERTVSQRWRETIRITLGLALIILCLAPRSRDWILRLDQADDSETEFVLKEDVEADTHVREPALGHGSSAISEGSTHIRKAPKETLFHSMRYRRWTLGLLVSGVLWVTFITPIWPGLVLTALAGGWILVRTALSR